MILNGQYGKGGTGGLLPRINVTAPMGSTVTVNGRATTKVSSLPSGYTELTYIESTGTQYIDTGVSYDSRTDSAEIETEVIRTNAIVICGSGTSTGTPTYTPTMIARDANTEVYYGNFISNIRTTTVASVNIKHSYKLNASSGTLTGTLDSTTFSGAYNRNSTLSLNVTLFGWNINGSYDLYSFKLFTFKMKKGGALVRNFIPCYRNSDSEVGLYDTVNNVFYTNQGTGSFVAGEEVFRYDCPSFGTYSVVGTLESQTKTESVLIDACQITNVTITY